MTELNDLPGGPAFVNRCVAVIADMALAFAGEPDDRVLAHLHGTKKHFEDELATQLGAENAAAVVDAMISATMARKHELESVSTTMGGTA